MAEQDWNESDLSCQRRREHIDAIHRSFTKASFDDGPWLNRARIRRKFGIGLVVAFVYRGIPMVRRATTDLEVSISPVQCIKTLRLLVEQAGWAVERHEGSRLVDRFAIIIPMAQKTRTLGLKITDGPLRGLELVCWSETRGSHGAINIASWLLPGGPKLPVTRALLDNWVSLLPRCPWRWTFGERSKIGYLLPIWRKSRKRFTSLGFDTTKRGWPHEAKSAWPFNEEEEE